LLSLLLLKLVLLELGVVVLLLVLLGVVWFCDCFVVVGCCFVLCLLGVVLIVVSGLGLVLLLMKKRKPILSFLLSSLCSWH